MEPRGPRGLLQERPSEPLMKPSDRQSFLQTCLRDEEELRHWRQVRPARLPGARPGRPAL